MALKLDMQAYPDPRKDLIRHLNVYWASIISALQFATDVAGLYPIHRYWIKADLDDMPTDKPVEEKHSMSC